MTSALATQSVSFASPVLYRPHDESPRVTHGRPLEYTPTHCDTVRRLVDLKISDSEIADYLGVSITTLIRWRADFPAFNKAMRRTADESDDLAEVSLFKRVTGFQYLTRKVFGPTKDSEAQIIEYFETVPPDTNAIRLWLGCRRPKQWREKSGGEDSESQSLLTNSLREAIRTIALETRSADRALVDVSPGAGMIEDLPHADDSIRVLNNSAAAESDSQS